MHGLYVSPVLTLLQLQSSTNLLVFSIQILEKIIFFISLLPTMGNSPINWLYLDPCSSLAQSAVDGRCRVRKYKRWPLLLSLKAGLCQ